MPGQRNTPDSAQSKAIQRVDTLLIGLPYLYDGSIKRGLPVTHAFRLRCLGAPTLFTDAGEQVGFRTRKHLALFVRLALEPGKQFTRDYLADLLWPTAAPKLANHSLAQGLSVIKAKIAREAVVLRRS